MGRVVDYEPCPKCHSRDNLARYDDGSAYCFGCKYCERVTGEEDLMSEAIDTTEDEVEAKPERAFIRGDFRAITSRNISESTCRKYGYFFGNYYNPKTKQTEGCHVAPFYDTEGTLSAQKVRFKDKNFSFIGGGSDLLFGRSVHGSGKYIVITEGELDCLAVAEVCGCKYPVVSLANGASSALKTLKKELKWLEDNFAQIVLMFDEDDAGRKAVAEVAPLFTKGKCVVAKLSEKDACDMLKAGKAQELASAVFNAKPYRPQGIVTLGDIKDAINEPVKMGLSYPWQTLTDLTYGARKQELVVLGAGTGVGKSELYKEIIVHFRTEHDQKVGILFLEETNAHTAVTLSGKVLGKAIHVPDVVCSDDEKDGALAILQGDDDSITLFNHFGHTDYAVIRSTIRHMVVGMGCDFVFLDHVSMLVSGDGEGSDSNKKLEYIMTDLSSMLRELDFGLFTISHLNTPEGKPHEEGGRVMLKHLRGSRSIAQFASFVFALERDQSKVDGVTTFRILKDRFTGRSTGKTFALAYDSTGNKLYETTAKSTGFESEEDY